MTLLFSPLSPNLHQHFRYWEEKQSGMKLTLMRADINNRSFGRFNSMLFDLAVYATLTNLFLTDPAGESIVSKPKSLALRCRSTLKLADDISIE